MYHLPDTSDDILLNIITWVYNSKLAVTGDNVLALLERSVYFDMEGITAICRDWLRDNTDQLFTNYEDIVNVLEMTRFFNMTQLVAEIQEWMLGRLRYENVLRMWKIGDDYNLDTVKKKAWSLLENELYLPRLTIDVDWFRLCRCQVERILSSDAVTCREEEVWRALVRWAEQCQDYRHSHCQEGDLTRLATSVRYDMLDV